MNEITGITGMNTCMHAGTYEGTHARKRTDGIWEKLWEESIWEAVSGLFS